MAAETHPSAAAGSSAVHVVSCWMCGIGLQVSQLVPDGGAWCGDVRWYCKDVRACTRRWTASRRALADRNARIRSGGPSSLLIAEWRPEHPYLVSPARHAIDLSRFG